MSDELDPDALASAYLDGDVDEVDRAQVEGDPALLARVERLRNLRGMLADTGPVDSALRDSALAAALAVFDAGDTEAEVDDGLAAAAAMAPMAAKERIAPVTPLRRSAPRWLAGIAAAAVVALAGVGIITSRGSDDDSAEQAPVTTDAPELFDESTGGDAPASERSDADASGEIESSDSVLSAHESPESTAASAPTGGATDTTTGAVQQSLPTIATPEQLEEYATELEKDRDTTDTTTASTESLTCGYAAAAVLGEVLYDGVPAYVIIDSAANQVLAVDADTCVTIVAVSR